MGATISGALLNTGPHVVPGQPVTWISMRAPTGTVAVDPESALLNT
jgi:hypothetical protein